MPLFLYHKIFNKKTSFRLISSFKGKKKSIKYTILKIWNCISSDLKILLFYQFKKQFELFVLSSDKILKLFFKYFIRVQMCTRSVFYLFALLIFDQSSISCYFIFCYYCVYFFNFAHIL